MTEQISQSDDDAVAIDEGLNELTNVEGAPVSAPAYSQAPSNVQTIKMDKVTKRYNGIIQYRAIFYDNSGKPLPNTDVLFEIDDNDDYQVKTDSEGIALLTIKITKGNHKIAALNPVSTNISYANFKVFDVVSGGKDIKMYYDGGNTYKVRIFDDNGKPLKAGQKVTFTINGKSYVKKTDKKGYAKLKITDKPGYYVIQAKYKDFAVRNTVYVKQVLKQLTSFKSKSLPSTFKYKVKFLGKNKKNKKLTVRFNKKTYKAKTNKKGIATFTLKTPKKSGSFTLTASYKKAKVSSTFSRYVA